MSSDRAHRCRRLEPPYDKQNMTDLTKTRRSSAGTMLADLSADSYCAAGFSRKCLRYGYALAFRDNARISLFGLWLEMAAQ